MFKAHLGYVKPCLKRNTHEHTHACTLTHTLSDIALMCTHSHMHMYTYTCMLTLSYAHALTQGSHMDPCTYMHVPQEFTIQYNFMAAFRHMVCVLYKESACNTLKVGKKI